MRASFFVNVLVVLTIVGYSTFLLYCKAASSTAHRTCRHGVSLLSFATTMNSVELKSTAPRPPTTTTTIKFYQNQTNHVSEEEAEKTGTSKNLLEESLVDKRGEAAAEEENKYNNNNNNNKAVDDEREGEEKEIMIAGGETSCGAGVVAGLVQAGEVPQQRQCDRLGRCYEDIPPLKGFWTDRLLLFPNNSSSSTSTTMTTFSAPICCGWARKKNQRYHPECGQSKMPREENGGRAYHGRTDFLAHMGGNGCTCGEDSNNNFKDRYIWQSSSSEDDDNDDELLLPMKFDPFEVCNRIGNRTVLFMGDSTMQQASSTLMNAVFPAGCQIKMTSMSSDTLIKQNFGSLNRGIHWLKGAKESNADIIIVSAGAHIYGEENFLNVLNSVIDGTLELQTLRPQTKVLWKSQQPGGCTEEAQYLDDPIQAALQFDWPNYNKSQQYQYADFWGRDLLALKRLPPHEIPVLDLRMLYSRSDAHIGGGDCLHLCSPGPLDIFPNVFQHYLRNEEKMMKMRHPA